MNEIIKGQLRYSMECTALDFESMNRIVGESVYTGEVCGHGVRDFTLVHHDDYMFWADAITGQLYDYDLLTCLSSDRLFLDGSPRITKAKVKKHRINWN